MDIFFHSRRSKNFLKFVKVEYQPLYWTTENPKTFIVLMIQVVPENTQQALKSSEQIAEQIYISRLIR